MNLPFTVEQFLAVFAQYNDTIWPFQYILILLAIGIIYLAVFSKPYSHKVIAAGLGFLWLWMGAIYHIIFFSPINPAAYGFGSLFIVQGLLFLWSSRNTKITFSATWGLKQSVGSLFIVYGLLLYPLLGIYVGHEYPSSPTFGAPCPTTIFTFGILLWSKNLPRFLLVIPVLWSMIGFSAALTLGMYEDIGLLISGIIGSLLIMMKDRNSFNTITSK
jgi:hypothetical protein